MHNGNMHDDNMHNGQLCMHNCRMHVGGMHNDVIPLRYKSHLILYMYVI